MGGAESRACCVARKEQVVEGDQTRSAVVLFGGSFSPMQLSHVAAAALGKKAVEASPHGLRVHSVRCSPVSDAYGKTGLWPAMDRLLLALLSLQENGEPGLVIDPWESQQPKFCETYLVAEHLVDVYKATGEADLVMLLGGADLFEGMFFSEPTPKIPYIWSKDSVANLMMQLDGIVIIQRSGAERWESEDIRARLKTKLEGTDAAARLDCCVIIVAEDSAGDGSSTQVRELIKSGLESKEQRSQLAQLVGQALTDEILSRAKYFCGLVQKS